MVIHRHGGPEVLTYEPKWPDPVAGPGEMVVRVHACALNPLDIFTREGMPGEPTPLPHITGGDIAGVVHAVGAGVETPRVGDRIVLNPSWGCGVCEYCRAGEDVLVHGAVGGVGLAAIQIAKLAGARVFATASTADKLERATALGADVAINYAEDKEWDVTVRRLTGKRGVDVIVETVGAAVWERSIRALGKGGRLVTTGATSGPIGPTDIRYLFR